jgi:hypothetical protein
MRFNTIKERRRDKMKGKPMKRWLIGCIVFVIILTSSSAYAQKLVTFRPDAESGVFMGFKWNENIATINNPSYSVIETYTTEHQNRATNKDEPKIIPGLTAANIKSILEKSWGLVFSGPQKGKLLLHDSGEAVDSDTGIHLMCDIYETSPQKVQWVNFIVDASYVMGLIEIDRITKLAERYFSSCVTISYDGANPTKAKQWVAKNVSKAIKPGELSIQIGKAEIKLFGTEYMRTLQITPIGGATPLY